MSANMTNGVDISRKNAELLYSSLSESNKLQANCIIQLVSVLLQGMRQQAAYEIMKNETRKKK